MSELVFGQRIEKNEQELAECFQKRYEERMRVRALAFQQGLVATSAAHLEEMAAKLRGKKAVVLESSTVVEG